MLRAERERRLERASSLLEGAEADTWVDTWAHHASRIDVRAKDSREEVWLISASRTSKQETFSCGRMAAGNPQTPRLHVAASFYLVLCSYR